jgi:tRNA/rRNA methyltransferase
LIGVSIVDYNNSTVIFTDVYIPMAVAVTLVEPQYPVNVGHIARLMKNFGLKSLYFVRPHFDKAEAAKYSTHGNDILIAAKSVTLSQLRKKFDVLIGTTAIQATSRLNILRESINAEQLAKIIHDSSTKDFCILLGRESSGLNNKELELCNLVVTIDKLQDNERSPCTCNIAVRNFQATTVRIASKKDQKKS